MVFVLFLVNSLYHIQAPMFRHPFLKPFQYAPSNGLVRLGPHYLGPTWALSRESPLCLGWGSYWDSFDGGDEPLHLPYL